MASFGGVHGLLFDLDGVFYVGDEPISGAQQTLAWVKNEGIDFRFITNTTTKTVSEVGSKLRGLGFDVPNDKIFSAITATRDYLKSNGTPKVQLLVRPSVAIEFGDFQIVDEKPDFVVVGDIGAAWNYELMNRVFRNLVNGAQLIAMHKTKFWQTPDGLSMDIGGFVTGLEYVSGQEAIITGKPSKPFFEMALNSMGLSKNETMMVGDDIENDIGGAQNAGLKAILVQTGKYRVNLVSRSTILPDLAIQSIAALPEVLKI